MLGHGEHTEQHRARGDSRLNGERVNQDCISAQRMLIAEHQRCLRRSERTEPSPSPRRDHELAATAISAHRSRIPIAVRGLAEHRWSALHRTQGPGPGRRGSRALSGRRCCARRASSEAGGEVCDRPIRPPVWSTTSQPTRLPGTPTHTVLLHARTCTRNPTSPSLTCHGIAVGFPRVDTRPVPHAPEAVTQRVRLRSARSRFHAGDPLATTVDAAPGRSAAPRRRK